MYRNKDAFDDWKIEGHKFEYLNIPYFELLDGVEEILPQIPTNKDVLVVCAKEGSSVMVAEMLSDAGREVAYLEGGMKSWSMYLEPIKVADLDKWWRIISICPSRKRLSFLYGHFRWGSCNY